MPFDNQDLRFECIRKGEFKTPKCNNDELLLQPFLHIDRNQPDWIYRDFVTACNYWLKIPEEKMEIISDLLSMICIDYFLADDIQDSTVVRGGCPTSYRIYGSELTIASVTEIGYVYLEKLHRLNHKEAITLGRKCLIEICTGSGIEMHWRDNFLCPTEEDWFAMSLHKSTSVFMLGLNLVQLFSDNKVDPTRLTALFGIFFHIRDDYCNFRSRAYEKSKGTMEDLTEGKYGFPSVHAINKQGRNGPADKILQQHTEDIALKVDYVKILEKLGSFEYTERILENFVAEMEIELKKLGKNPLMEKVIYGICDWKSTGLVI